MAAPALDYAYCYPFASTVRTGPRSTRLSVATSGGDAAEQPHFYSGGLVAPARAAQLLLAVSGVAASRFYVPPAMLTRILLHADPIVLSDGEWLRFEALSACCGVYARADLLPNALAAEPVGQCSLASAWARSPLRGRGSRSPAQHLQTASTPGTT